MKARCFECGEKRPFTRIGRVKPIPYECAMCGNVQRGPHCAECGGTSFRYNWPFKRKNYCASCGAKNTIRWEQR